MKKVLALILAVMMILPMTVTTFAEEDDGDWTTAPSKYTQVKVFTGTYGFGTEEMNVYANDDLSAFYIYFWSFDSDQVLEGTVEDGICNVDFDYSGFMTGDCQLIWDDAMASEEEWTPVSAETAAPAAQEEQAEAAEAEEPETAAEAADAEGMRNGYPIIEIESDLALQDNYARTVENAVSKHPYEEYQGYIIFYGASNFARWTSMNKDMPDYKIINHAFGGSTDLDLVYFANIAVFPYNPSIIFFQTGSNDYVNQEGTDEEKIEKCMNFKYQMFDAFHEIMPDTKFVVMSGLLLPGRAEYVEMTQEINRRLKALADEKDYIYFVDASDFTYDGENFHEELFNDDQIHLTKEGLQAWAAGYIVPALEQVITENGLDSVRQ